MSRNKGMFAAALLLVMLACGAYLAGWLALWLLGLPGVAPTWHTWADYFRALGLPQLAPWVGRIKLAGAVGFGAPLLVWLLALIPLFRRRVESLHGDASFASVADMRRAGLLRQTPQGILIGKVGRHRLWLNGPQHLVMVAPTRSGKTTSVAIPVLCTYADSIVVLDLKGELRKATSGRRVAMGQRVHVWAPYDEHGCTDRFNPFTLLDGLDAGKRLGEIQTIAAILYPDEPGKDPFWTSQARAAFTAFAGYLFEAWDCRLQTARELPDALRPAASTDGGFPSFERILRFSSGVAGENLRAVLQKIVAAPNAHPWISAQTRTAFANLAGLAEQTFSSVVATVQAPLQQFLNPTLAAATNATDFDIGSFRRQPTTLYVDIPTNKLDESGKLLNIFFSCVIGNNLTRQLGDTPDLRHQMLMLMDEFTAMGRVDVWARRISISASYGVRDVCIVQSRAQLRGTYGDQDAQNFITNHGCQIAFTPREQADASEYSEMLGYRTVRRRHRSTSSGGAGSVSIHYSEERRALMLPQEIKELPADDELIFLEGCKPIRARKNWYFKDKQFVAWTKLPPVTVAPRGGGNAAADGLPPVWAATPEMAAMLAQ